MAWNFAKEIHSLTGYDADDTVGYTISTDLPVQNGSADLVYSDHTTQWLRDGAKEVLSYLSPELLQKCIQISSLSNSPSTLTNVSQKFRVVSVTRKDGIRYKQAREIPGIAGGVTATDGRASDPDDLLYYGTKSDPVYWKYNDTLFVYPVPTATELAKIENIPFPTPSYNDTAISDTDITASVSAATKANPAVFTAASHGFSVGDTVKLSGFTDMTELNGITSQVLAVADANTFTLEGIDSTNYTNVGTSGIAEKEGFTFPAEAERVVVLYEAIKALQYKLSEIYNEEDIDASPFDDVMDSINDGQTNIADSTDNLGYAASHLYAGYQVLDGIDWNDYDYAAIKTAISTITSTITELGTLNLDASDGPLADASTMLDRLNDGTSTEGYLTTEDTELANTAISGAQGYIAEASATVSEFSANVSAINSALQAAQAASTTASTFIQSKIAEAASKIQVAAGYVSQAQGYIATAQTYFQEAQTLTQYYTTKYNWYKDQMQLLTADYARGVASISGQPLSQGGERRKRAE